MKTNLCLLVSLLVTVLCATTLAQSSKAGLENSLHECYGNITLYDRSIRIPASSIALSAMMDRIERIPNLNMDMRMLSATLVHRFRVDGVERAPTIQNSPGVIPFTTSGFQNGRYRLLVEQLLPGSAVNFPNASLTAEERCAMHFWMSTTVDKWERGDESTVCNVLQNFRSYNRAPRSLEGEDPFAPEILSKEDTTDGLAARQIHTPESTCPIEDGVVWTPWGAVTAGTLIAGIATGLQRQDVTVRQLGLNESPPGGRATTTPTGPINNLYAASFSGDLGEVVLLQGPRYAGQVIVGASGGLILGMAMPDLQNALGSRLTISQVLDMYYSERGMPTKRNMRACQRKEHMASVAPNDVLVTQTRNIIPALEKYLAHPYVSQTTMDSYINNAVSRLLSYVPSLNDKACEMQNDPPNPNEFLATPTLDLNVVVDPTWAFDDALSYLAAILREVPPHSSGSTLSMYIGSTNDVPMINYTRSILDFYGNFTSERYRYYGSSQLDVKRSMSMMRGIYSEMREADKKWNRAGGRSQILLFAAYNAMGATDEQSKLSMQNEFRLFREANPDVRVLFLCSGNKDRFRDLVLDPEQDIFQMNAPPGYTGTPDVRELVERLKELPDRLTNPECGAKWDGSPENNGGGQTMTFYADPLGITYLRLMPNYFFESDEVIVRIQGVGQGKLTVCFSRTNEQPKSVGEPGQSGSTTEGVTCRTLTASESTEFRAEWPCDKVRNAIDCKPMHFSVVATESLNRCAALTSGSNVQDGCRFPDMVRFSMTVNGLGCYSGASLPAALSISVLLLIAALRSLLN
ncbi:hypothetical protein B566_EDAN015352 [Ephemera danica]|nr:hypothetical protein B566_EDAN015352 [Ephemera danica]